MYLAALVIAYFVLWTQALLLPMSLGLTVLGSCRVVLAVIFCWLVVWSLVWFVAARGCCRCCFFSFVWPTVVWEFSCMCCCCRTDLSPFCSLSGLIATVHGIRVSVQLGRLVGLHTFLARDAFSLTLWTGPRGNVACLLRFVSWCLLASLVV